MSTTTTSTTTTTGPVYIDPFGPWEPEPTMLDHWPDLDPEAEGPLDPRCSCDSAAGGPARVHLSDCVPYYF